jgi:serine/threonine protein kinase
MVTGSSLDKIYMVMEYFEADLKSVLTAQKTRGEALGTAEVKCLLLQLIRAVAYLHKHWFIHRDLKTSNLLYSSKGASVFCSLR